MILPSIIPFSSQYPLHFDTCAGKTASKKSQSTKDSLNVAIAKCRRDGVAGRSTLSRSGQGKGSGGGGGGGGDDRRNYRKPLPEDAYINWMEDELARLIDEGSRVPSPLCKILKKVVGYRVKVRMPRTDERTYYFRFRQAIKI